MIEMRYKGFQSEVTISLDRAKDGLPYHELRDMFYQFCAALGYSVYSTEHPFEGDKEDTSITDEDAAAIFEEMNQNREGKN